jgi:teichoic acid transport system ATP-binding protein
MDVAETNTTGLLAPPPDATMVLRDLHVRYHIAGRTRPRVKDLLVRAKGEASGPSGRVIHAVRGLDLVARRGESIGFVGRNGSGKSTTLAAMAGLLPASSGEVLSTSQPVLLGVGAAMQSNLTGRRNIELGCLALGMNRERAAAAHEEIVDFAELGDFIELPIKTYSSGMRARLHFAVATAIEPEILLIDEALSVGDEHFRKKSGERIKELLDGAGTVFIVSHSMSTLEEACSRVLWIDKGSLMMDGDPAEVIEAYKKATV